MWTLLQQVSIPVGPIYTQTRGAERWRGTSFNSSRSDLYQDIKGNTAGRISVSIPVGPIYTGAIGRDIRRYGVSTPVGPIYTDLIPDVGQMADLFQFQ